MYNSLTMLKAKPKNLKNIKPIDKTRREMIMLKKAGFTLESIGIMYNVSKQRVHQIINGR